MITPQQQPVDILVLDIETTGLNPANDCILEISFIPAQLTHDKLHIDYKASFSSVIAPYKFGFDKMSPNVRRMHESSGLLQEVGQTLLEVNDVETNILTYINSLFGHRATKIQLCGNSIHFDRSFIKTDMKRLEQRLSYRMLDVTPFRTLKQMLVSTEESIPKHRALEDCTYSAQLLAEFYEALCINFRR